MSSLFRCETMKYVHLIMDEESARDTIRDIGERGFVHIEDHGSPEKRLYKENKRRILDCLVWQRKLQDFRVVMKRNGVKPPGPEIQDDDGWKPAGDCLEQIQRYFEQTESDLTIQFNFKTQEMIERNTLLERKYVLKRIYEEMGLSSASHYEPAFETKGDNLLSEGLLEDGITKTINGTIPTSNQSLFERMIYRVAKGHNNALCSFKKIEAKEPFDDPSTGEPAEKAVFSVVVVGSELPRRIRKICALFGATIFEVPNSKAEIDKELKEIDKKRVDSNDVLQETKKRIEQYLNSLARNKKGGSPLVLWERAIAEEMRICEALQKFYMVEDQSNNEQKGVGGRIAAKCWVPEENFADLQQVLRSSKSPMASMCQVLDMKHKMPPTYFKTNVFTGTYQSIVDTYGVANYKEANPGLFTIVTFPFLFGVMYGDIFHGSCLTIAAIFMLYNEKYFCEQRRRGELGEMFGMAFAGRYMLILMGIFAIFCGTIYNDCASIPLNIYGSRYEEGYVNGQNNTVFNRTSEEHYPWGLDPAWYHKTNSLQFQNSLKMKYAVTIGVIQMTFGIILGLTNDCYHKDVLGMVFEFLPRILFMLTTFGYMIFMILYKFTIDWTGRDAPGLIQTMIKMFLSPTSKPETPLYDADTQHFVQLMFVIIAGISIPVMLFPKALIKKQIWKKKFGHLHQQNNNYEGNVVSVSMEEHGISMEEPHHEEEHHDHRWVHRNWTLSDELIGTGIHTIEFILGCVSNTASYLRLWALSLAHAELSEVFWDKMMMDYGLLRPGLGFVGMAAWIAVTVGVLLLMDVLESFLHALRLHWVEFQNKFYQGEGHKFEPFKLS